MGGRGGRREGVSACECLLSLTVVLVSAGLLKLLAEQMRVPRIINTLLTKLVLKPTKFKVLTRASFVRRITRVKIVILVFATNVRASVGRLGTDKGTSFVVTLYNIVIPLVKNCNIT